MTSGAFSEQVDFPSFWTNVSDQGAAQGAALGEAAIGFSQRESSAEVTGGQKQRVTFQSHRTCAGTKREAITSNFWDETWWIVPTSKASMRITRSTGHMARFSHATGQMATGMRKVGLR